MNAARLTLVCFFFGFAATPAQAGWLLTSGLEYQTFAFRPEVDEPTPNYHGYGLELSGGYSLARVVDAALFARYAPSRLESAKVNSQEAVLYSYGGTLGVRLAETIYFGFGGGPFTYDLRTQTREEEVPGRWQGMGAHVAVGAFTQVERQRFLQVALRFGTATLERSDEIAATKRKVDTFAVTMTYLWNAEDKFKLSNSIISDFVSSMNFL